MRGRQPRSAGEDLRPDRPRLGREDVGTPSVVYAVGDVHGCLTQLRDLERRIVADAAGLPGRKLLVMLGDYVDRGPSSAAVIDHLLAPAPEDFDRVCLCGNHEALMLAFLGQPLAHRDWLELGGEQTLRSYGILFGDLRRRTPGEAGLVDALEAAIPRRHRAFLEGLPVLLDLGDFVFAHAGLAPGVPIEEQSTQDLLWIREPFLRRGPELAQADGRPLTVVHGHTPSSLPTFGTGRIGIDTGAFMTGRLTALRILDGQPFVL